MDQYWEGELTFNSSGSIVEALTDGYGVVILGSDVGITGS